MNGVPFLFKIFTFCAFYNLVPLSYLHLKVILEKYELTERKMIGFFLMYFGTN